MEDWKPAVRVLEEVGIRNGTPASATERANPLRRIEWVPISEQYSGYEVKLWQNPTYPAIGPAEQLRERDHILGTIAMMKVYVLDHRCPDGHGGYQPWPHPFQDGPLPAPTEDEFWDNVPGEIIGAITAHIQDGRKKFQASVERILGGSTAS